MIFKIRDFSRSSQLVREATAAALCVNCGIGSAWWASKEELAALNQRMRWWWDKKVRDCIDTLMQYVDATYHRDIQSFHEQLSTLKWLFIRQQYQRGLQIMLDSFFKPKPASTVTQPIILASPPLAQSPSTAPPLSSQLSTSPALEATSSATEYLPGFFIKNDTHSMSPMHDHVRRNYSQLHMVW